MINPQSSILIYKLTTINLGPPTRIIQKGKRQVAIWDVALMVVGQ
jgi:hypothetical protein